MTDPAQQAIFGLGRMLRIQSPDEADILATLGAELPDREHCSKPGLLQTSPQRKKRPSMSFHQTYCHRPPECWKDAQEDLVGCLLTAWMYADQENAV